MPTLSQLRSSVLSAKERLTEGHRTLQQRHRAGDAGKNLCAGISDLRDAVLRELFEAALADLGEAGPSGLQSQVALVAHGGYGRRDVAPYSDVDLMILHTHKAAQRVGPLAQRLLRDVFDAGLQFGHSVRTPEQACRLAIGDPTICTSLIESRLLIGNSRLFGRFAGRFRRQVQQRARALTAAMESARQQERSRYGETVFLLEPDIKRSRGGLRDLQLLRWIGFTRYGTADPEQLQARDVLSEADFRAIDRAGEFLLRLRNELHFRAGRAVDVLDRAEQVRIADALDYRAAAGMLPVEQFMRDYFRHTNGVSHVAARVADKARTRDRVARLVTATFGHRVEGGVRVGPGGLMVTLEGLQAFRGNLTEIMRLMALANLYDKPIAPSTWEVIRLEASRLPDVLPAEARLRFLSLLAHPARLGPLLRDLHETAILQRFIPEFEHARGLLQFNQYHKYTVDEHCFRALEFATELSADSGPLGEAYRRIKQKRVLHLALLIHDLGKGFDEDHHAVGLAIAQRTSERLGLPAQEAEALKFLVHEHSLMNHLAFRRDTGDPQLLVRLAVEVGSPELLRMLYVMTAADLGAVGPGVWDGWKAQIVTDLYRRTVRHLVVDSFGAVDEFQGPAADRRPFDDLAPGQTLVEAQYLAETDTVRFSVGTSEQITPGVFHKLTGALAGLGLRIRSAQINTLADGLVLDRFWVHDPDFAGQPPSQRLEQIKAALVQSLRASRQAPPAFRRTWNTGKRPASAGRDPQTRVQADNSTSQRCTILDVFAMDRPGLLYAVARTLFELGLFVWQAKIDTYLDQVVDVFYVTDPEGGKIESESRLEEIRRRLLEVIESLEET